MIVDKFTGPEGQLRLSEDKRSCAVIAEPRGFERSKGVADFFSGNLVALFADRGGLWLTVNGTEFDIADAEFMLRYEHLSDGRTLFRVSDSRLAAEVVYPSWWVGNKGASSAGLGSHDDDEMDICAYLQFMLSSPIRANHLKEKFLGKAETEK